MSIKPKYKTFLGELDLHLDSNAGNFSLGSAVTLVSHWMLIFVGDAGKRSTEPVL